MLVTRRSRMGVRSPWRAPAVGPRAPVPAHRTLITLAALFCLALRATSIEVLLGSEPREGGRVLACRYFTGTRVTERQYLATGHRTDRRGCPVVRVG